MSTPLGTKIKTLREKKGWSKYRLSKESGVATTTITKIERGDIYPELETLLKLANALDIDIDELFGVNKVMSPEDKIKEIFKNIHPRRRPEVLKELIDLINA